MSDFENYNLTIIQTAKGDVECEELNLISNDETISETERTFREAATHTIHLFNELNKTIKGLCQEIGTTDPPSLIFIEDNDLYFLSDYLDESNGSKNRAPATSYMARDGSIFVNTDRLLESFKDGVIETEFLHNLLAAFTQMCLNHYSVQLGRDPENGTPLLTILTSKREIDVETYEYMSKSKGTRLLKAVSIDKQGNLPKSVSAEALMPDVFFKSHVVTIFATTFVLNQFYSKSKMARRDTHYSKVLLDIQDNLFVHMAFRGTYKTNHIVGIQHVLSFLTKNKITLSHLLFPNSNKEFLSKVKDFGGHNLATALQFVFKIPPINANEYLGYIGLKLGSKPLLGAVNYAETDIEG